MAIEYLLMGIGAVLVMCWFELRKMSDTLRNVDYGIQDVYHHIDRLDEMTEAKRK